MNGPRERIVYDDGAGNRIIAITLSKEDQKRLCTGGARLPAYSAPAQDESVLHGLGWTLASVIIGAAMGWLIAGWLQ